MNYLSVRLGIFSLLLASFVFLSAHASANIFSTPVFKSFSLDEGLSQITVADIAEDKYGYIWLATQSGIDRFDGYTFKHFGKWKDNESDGLTTLTAFQIEASLDGEYLWVGTISGLSRFHVDSETFEHFPLPTASSIQMSVIKRILIDNTGTVWVISGRSLYRFSNLSQKLVRVAFLDNTTSTLTDIIIDTNNTVWVSATSGLYQLNPVYNTLDSYDLSGVNISVMKVAKDNSIWVGTATQGVCRYPLFHQDGTQPSHCFSEKSGLENSAVIALLVQDNNDLWIATESGLNVVFNNNLDKVWHVPAAQTSLADDRVMSFYQSSEGLIFAGTRDKGFSVYNPNLASFSTFHVGESQKITGLSYDSDSYIWITSEENLMRYNYATSEIDGPYLSTTQVNGSNSQNKLLSVHYDRQFDTVWMATRSGLGRFRPGDKGVELVGLNGKSGYSINVDEQGDVWYGGYSDGVFVYQPNTDQVVRQWPLSLTTRIVFHNNEFTWLASVSGLYLANKHTGVLKNIGMSHNNFPDDAVVTWMSRSISGGYWVATQGSGIFFMTIEGNDVSSISFKQILPDSYLSSVSLGAIVEDERGGIWISYTEGIAYIEPTLTSISYFGPQNGASKTGYYIGSAAQSTSGTIMMGGPQGMTVFSPNDIKQTPWSPKVQITSVEVLSKVTNSTQNVTRLLDMSKLTLAPDDISFSAEFSALNFSNPNEVRYAYKLSDFDPNWRYTDYRRRIATYSNLDAGKYTLTVRAMNKEDKWSPFEAQLTILVIPPWWEKTLWQAVIIASGLLIVSLLIWWRISSLKNRSATLAVMVEEKTRDLEEAVERLTKLSSQDPLTGLKNRRYFTNRAEQAWDSYQRYAQPFSLMLVDIDWFKKTNDTYGHHVGDLVLVKLAEILNENLRNSDVISRWGGEEFLVLLPELNVHEAYWVAEKLRKAVANTLFHCEGNDLHITITAGVSDIRDCESVQHCIHSVDKKLYKGKASGRNSVQK